MGKRRAQQGPEPEGPSPWPRHYRVALNVGGVAFRVRNDPESGAVSLTARGRRIGRQLTTEASSREDGRTAGEAQWVAWQ